MATRKENSLIKNSLIRMNRRAALRSAGAVLALPFLETLPRPAGAKTNEPARPPLRLGIYTVTGGTVLESWRAPQAGRLEKLPSILRPLEFARDDLLLLTGLSHHGASDGLNGHEHCAFLHLTGAPKARREAGRPISTVSVDQAAAERIGRETLLPSLELGLTNQETKYSFRSSGQQVPYEADPRQVFQRMFRGRPLIGANWRRRAGAPAPAAAAAAPASYDRSVLDVLLAEVNDLERDLSKSDKRRLEEYLASVRGVERRLDLFESKLRVELADLAAAGGRALPNPNLPGPGVPFWQVEREIHEDPEKHAEYIRLMGELWVLAFQTDTTRVATLAAGSDEALFPGVVTVGYERHCHTLEHQGNAGRVEDADPIAREALRQIHAWYTQLFAEIVARLKSIDEGGTSLLDNCLLLYTSYMANGGHGLHDYPALLVGKRRGRFAQVVSWISRRALPCRTSTSKCWIDWVASRNRSEKAGRPTKPPSTAACPTWADGCNSDSGGLPGFSPCSATGSGANVLEKPLFFAVGHRGGRCASTDGKQLSELTTGREGEIYRAIACGNGRAVAVGTFGGSNQFGTTTEGATWQTSTQDAKYRYFLRGLCFGGDRFLGLGGDPGSVGSSSPFVMSSSNGIQWSALSPITGKEILRRAACGNDRFVAVGDRGRRATSKDGETWEDAPNSRALDTLIDVAFGAGVFVGVGLHGLRMTTADGITWSEPLRGEEGEHLNVVVWTGKEFVAVGQGATLTSPDGRRWERTPNQNAPITMAYGNGQFVGAAWKGRLLVSNDAVTWEDAHRVPQHIEAVAWGVVKFGE